VATRGYGAEVVLHGATTIEAFAEYDRLRAAHRLVAVHPFDDPHVIAGQGTVGLEILDDVPDVDAVVVPVGGGGLICGIATALKEQRPGVRVVGVEPDGAPSLTRALEAGRVVPLPSVQTLADGLAAPFAGPLTLDIAQRYVDDVVLVSDDEIVEALRLTLERIKLQVEPAGAAGVAALLARRCGVRPGARVVAVLSGGNVDRARLKEIL
jgi:threonine dehydratase